MKVANVTPTPILNDVSICLSGEEARCLFMLANDHYAVIHNGRDGYHKHPTGAEIKQFQRDLYVALRDQGVQIP